MSPDSFETYRRIEEQLQTMANTLARVEERLEGFTAERQRAHDDHVSCRASVDKELEDLDLKYDRLGEAFSRLLTWGKAIAVIGSAAGTALVVLNILLAVGRM
jgi:hypothetical protein